MATNTREAATKDVEPFNLDDLPLNDLDDVAERVLPGGRLKGRINIYVELNYPFSIRIPWMTIGAFIAGLLGGHWLPSLM